MFTTGYLSLKFCTMSIEVTNHVIANLKIISQKTFLSKKITKWHPSIIYAKNGRTCTLEKKTRSFKVLKSSNVVKLLFFYELKNYMEVVEWSARLSRKRAFRVRRLLAPSSIMHVLLQLKCLCKTLPEWLAYNHGG